MLLSGEWLVSSAVLCQLGEAAVCWPSFQAAGHVDPPAARSLVALSHFPIAALSVAPVGPSRLRESLSIISLDRVSALSVRPFLSSHPTRQHTTSRQSIHFDSTRLNPSPGLLVQFPSLDLYIRYGIIAPQEKQKCAFFNYSPFATLFPTNETTPRRKEEKPRSISIDDDSSNNDQHLATLDASSSTPLPRIQLTRISHSFQDLRLRLPVEQEEGEDYSASLLLFNREPQLSRRQ